MKKFGKIYTGIWRVYKTYYKYYGTRDFTAPLGSTTYYTGYSD